MEFWSNKKVLITGHTGFNGSWLSLWLQSMGAKVVGLLGGGVVSSAIVDVGGTPGRVVVIAGVVGAGVASGVP